MLNFAQPIWLFGLLLLPLLAMVHWRRAQGEREALEAFAREPALAKMAVRLGTDARLLRGGLIVLAVGCGLLALAQPRWGASDAGVGETATNGSLVIALDVSKSMLTRDAGGESRLAACQHLVKDLMPELPGWRIGLAAFAGQGQALVPLTTDHDAVQTMMERAQIGLAPGAGTNIEAGLKAAAALFSPGGRHVLLLLTDGEELSGHVDGLAPTLQAAQIEVLALGVGSSEGGYIPAALDLWGNPAYLTYHGDKVVSHLDERPLKQLADATRGAYVHAGEAFTVPQLKARLARGVGALAGQPGTSSAASELFQVPLGLALALVTLEALWSLLGVSRREKRFADALRRVLAPAGGAGGRWRKRALGLLLLAIAQSQTAWTLLPSWVPNGRAAKAYEQGHYDQAFEILKAAIIEDPHNYRLLYNMGNVYYQQGQYQPALNYYQRAYDAADERARPAIGYNLGNAAFRKAEATGQPALYQRAIENYQNVLAAKPDDADAAFNLALARERLKAAKPPSKPKSGQAGRSGSAGAGGRHGDAHSVGARSSYKPPPPIKNLPSEGEVDALLKALESDERQRQAEQGAADAANPNAAAAPQGNFLQQAFAGSLDKDW